MRRAALLASLALLGLAALSADAATQGFRHGVVAGEITPTSAMLWTRAPREGSVRVLVSAEDR